MRGWLLAHEPEIRLGFFATVFVVMAVWELAAPRRALTSSKAKRWLSNLGILLIDGLLLRLLFPAAAVGMAWLAAERGWGLFNNVGLPSWLVSIVSVMALDLIIYLQHVMFHAVPALWRLHMVHHADLDFDLTTGIRFHPLEVILSMLIKMASVAVLGPPVIAVITFEILLNATSMFNHGNVRLPAGVDRLVRWLLVTPDMHRVHHSARPTETNSNFGFNLTWWDRLFGTYRSQPAAGHEQMTIGLWQFREPPGLTLPLMLALPFFGQPGAYPFNPPIRQRETGRLPSAGTTDGRER